MEKILTSTLSSCVASHFFPSDMIGEYMLNVYKKPHPQRSKKL